MKVIIKNITRILDNFFKIDRAVLRYERFDGTLTDEVVRLNFNRGNSVAVLVVNKDKETVILTKQFRFPAYSENSENGWLLEIVAGMVEKNISVEETAKKEVLEEIGYEASELIPICSFYPSPGGCSERIFLFFAEVTEKDKTQPGGGVIEETEDIKIIELEFADAFRKLDNRDILDAKTIIALQWLRNQT